MALLKLTLPCVILFSIVCAASMRLSSHQSASEGSSASHASPFGGRCPPASSTEQSTHEKSPVSARDWLRPQHEI
eukprot:6427161-Prymnesium_polylepis.1